MFGKIWAPAAAALLIGSFASADEVNVVEANGKFDHDRIVIKAGASIVAVNNDSGDHNLSMTNDDGEATDIGLQHPGVKVRVNFDSPGEYKLRCSITPDMRMTVIVN